MAQVRTYFLFSAARQSIAARLSGFRITAGRSKVAVASTIECSADGRVRAAVLQA
jgi:hypothetical protein